MHAFYRTCRDVPIFDRAFFYGDRLVRGYRRWRVSEPGRLSIRVWVLRYALRRLLMPRTSSADITQPLIRGWFINLENRPDRRRETTAHLDQFQSLKLERWPAASNGNGALGCAESHAGVIQHFISENLDFALVAEDDIEFLASEAQLRAIVSEFLQNPTLDVLCLANNNQISPRRISPALSISCSTQTAAAYLLKRRAAKPLLEKFRRSITLFKAGEPKKVAAIDQQWKPLQRGALVFAVPHERVARQRPSFSDIERRTVNYGV